MYPLSVYTELCRKCREDKAGISRILSDLEEAGMIYYQDTENGKKYRAKALLTEEGVSYGAKINTYIARAVVAGGNGLNASDTEVFYRVLFTIADNLEELCSRIEQKG